MTAHPNWFHVSAEHVNLNRDACETLPIPSSSGSQANQQQQRRSTNNAYMPSDMALCARRWPWPGARKGSGIYRLPKGCMQPCCSAVAGAPGRPALLAASMCASTLRKQPNTATALQPLPVCRAGHRLWQTQGACKCATSIFEVCSLITCCRFRLVRSAWLQHACQSYAAVVLRSVHIKSSCKMLDPASVVLLKQLCQH